jgi:hypothetical protein
MSLDSKSEDEMLLAEAEKGNDLQHPQFRRKIGRNSRRQFPSMRVIALAALSSSIFSVVATIITYKLIFPHSQHLKDEGTNFLPGLDLPICKVNLKSETFGIERQKLTGNLVGTNQAVFMPEQIYRQPPTNTSYEAWMKLFPSSYIISL